MPGTAADPVRLDPFQRITEVHWPAGFMVAVAIDIEFDTTVTTHTEAKIPQLSMTYGGASEAGFGGWPVVDDNPTDQTVASDSAYAADYVGGIPDIVMARVWNIRDEIWEIPAFTPPVTGLPTIAVSSSFSPWTLVPVPVDVDGLAASRWTTVPGGNGQGLSTPSTPPVPFDGDLAPHVQMLAIVNGDGTTPAWYRFGPDPFTVVTFGLRTPGATGASENALDEPIDFSGLRVTYLGRVYVPVSTAAVANDLDGDFRLRLWVLCIRE
jgi:hypothetical protein